MTGGNLPPKTKYMNTEEAAQDKFESALDGTYCGMAHTRAILMCNDGNGWLMMEEKTEKNCITEWVEHDFNLEITFDDGQFLEVSQASTSSDSALSEVQLQYQDEDLLSVEYVGWTS